MLKTSKKNVCRVPRSDKSIVAVAERDTRILHWSAKQYAFRFDQVKCLLSRE